MTALLESRPQTATRPYVHENDITVARYEIHDGAYDPNRTTRNGMAKKAIVDYLNDGFIPEIHQRVQEPTAEQQRQTERARSFVAKTVGIQPTVDVYWQTDRTYANSLGVHSTTIDTNYIAEPTEKTSDAYRRMERMATLIHEFAHATGNEHHIDILRYQPESASDDSNNDAYPRLGMHVTRVDQKEPAASKVQGMFFEEAFAEETAARWRETEVLYTRLHGNELIDIGVAQLPLRFFDYDDTAIADKGISPTWINSAYPAHAISLLSEASGTDLYGLMVEMRTHPENKAALKREFIAAINSVEPGLYKRLRETNYNRKEFVEALQHVSEVVADKE